MASILGKPGGPGQFRTDDLSTVRGALQETIIWAKRQLPRRRAKRRRWRQANINRLHNKGGRPGAARRSGPATFDFATGAGAARRVPSEWLRRSNKRLPHMRA